MVYSHSRKLKVCKVSKSLKIWAMPIWAMPRMGSSRIYNNLLVHWIWVWIFKSLNKFENIFCMPCSHALQALTINHWPVLSVYFQHKDILGESSLRQKKQAYSNFDAKDVLPSPLFYPNIHDTKNLLLLKLTFRGIFWNQGANIFDLRPISLHLEHFFTIFPLI